MLRFRQVLAALSLALIAAAAVLPLAAAGAEPRGGCHCVVRMECCEDGTCTMRENEPPATGPEWRNCRREHAAATTPFDAFERAVTQPSRDKDKPREQMVDRIVADSIRGRVPSPATPPPRLFSF